MRSDIEICSFTAGELTPRLKGRTDYKNYFNGCATLANMVVLPQGGVTRRPGFQLAALSKDQTDAPFRVRLRRFTFSTVQSYMLEFSDGNVRVYMQDAAVLSGGVPVDIAVPYQAADLAALQFTQSADTLYIDHPAYPPATVTRSSHTSWTYSVTQYRDGPYLDVNVTDTTLSPSGQTGSITLEASAADGINGGRGFVSADVGRHVRIKLYSLWAWCIITAVTDTTHVTATVQDKVNGGATAGIDGQAWVASTDYPTGAVVLSNGLYYQAVLGGTSNIGFGPAGTGLDILDGTVTWNTVGGFNDAPWVGNSYYNTGNIVSNGSGIDKHHYICVQPGNANGEGSGPSGTGQNIADASVIWNYLPPFSFPTSTKDWALGKWSATTGHPYIPTFWQQRLAHLGTDNQPSAAEASSSSDFTNFAPTAADGTVLATNALSWVISDDQVNAIRWSTAAGSSVAMQLGIGTTGGEQIMQPATNSLALSQTNVQVYPETRIGSAPNVPAIRIGKSVLFANRSGRKVLDWIWQWAINGYLAVDRTVDAEHITRPVPATLQGIITQAYQQQPYGIDWCVLGDGNLIGLTYLPEQQVQAWHRHTLGGAYYGGHPIVESIDTIPSPDGSYDELWASVLRTVAGVPTRTTEVMARFFDGQPQEEAFFVDCGIRSSLVQPAATLLPAGMAGDGVLFSADADVFDADSVGAMLRVNNGVAVITAVADARNVTADYLSPATSTRPLVSGAWSCTPQYQSFGGIPELNGATVQILGDGADFGTQTVVNGGVALDGEASYATLGLPIEYETVTMPWAPARALPAPATGKAKIIDHLYLRLHETLGCDFGQLVTDEGTGEIFPKMESLQTRSAGDIMGQAPPLYSGIQRLPMPSSFDLEGQIRIAGSGPYPCTVLGICASSDVGTT
ncbi:MAG TPA: hypothetical protein VGG48_01895 [Rhizomicrobium sp.]|jgi:hypothetical protein